jgi:hypothetical protein
MLPPKEFRVARFLRNVDIAGEGESTLINFNVCQNKGVGRLWRHNFRFYTKS